MSTPGDRKGKSTYHSTARWTATYSPSPRYIDALYHTCDGNFQQTQKIKPMDANDYPLTLNGSYYSNERDFETFRKSRPRATQDVRMFLPIMLTILL